MIDHLSTYTTDYERTKNFYKKVFGVLGCSLQTEFVATWNANFPTQRICAYGPPTGKPNFWIIETKDKYTPRHIAFSASNRSVVEQFYSIGLENGGTDNGSPGLRPMYHPNYFGAFLLDPDGNNVEAVTHAPQ